MTMIKCPFVPDYIQCYQFGECEQCKLEKSIDPKFDNENCPHCKKLTKVMAWGPKKDA